MKYLSFARIQSHSLNVTGLRDHDLGTLQLLLYQVEMAPQQPNWIHQRCVASRIVRLCKDSELKGLTHAVYGPYTRCVNAITHAVPYKA